MSCSKTVVAVEQRIITDYYPVIPRPSIPVDQRFITDYYPVIKRRGGIHCYRCKRKFISTHHRSLHTRGGKNCKWNPKGKPMYKLEYMDEEILLHITSYLCFDWYNSLLKFIHALPRLLYVHGMKSLWQRKLNDCDFSYKLRWSLFIRQPDRFNDQEYTNEHHLTNRCITTILAEKENTKEKTCGKYDIKIVHGELSAF